MRSNGTVVRDLAKGAIAGAVATWLMNQATTWMQAFPWQTHARGLGGHLAFGLTTELVLDGLDRLAA